MVSFDYSPALLEPGYEANLYKDSRWLTKATRCEKASQLLAAAEKLGPKELTKNNNCCLFYTLTNHCCKLCE